MAEGRLVLLALPGLIWSVHCSYLGSLGVTAYWKLYRDIPNASHR